MFLDCKYESSMDDIDRYTCPNAAFIIVTVLYFQNYYEIPVFKRPK